MHDAQFGVAQEVRGAAQAIEHARAERVSRVRVRVDVDLKRRVHRNHAETADELRGVRDLLRAQ